jgi:hypothetical protein
MVALKYFIFSNYYWCWCVSRVWCWCCIGCLFCFNFCTMFLRPSRKKNCRVIIIQIIMLCFFISLPERMITICVGYSFVSITLWKHSSYRFFLHCLILLCF